MDITFGTPPPKSVSRCLTGTPVALAKTSPGFLLEHRHAAPTLQLPFITLFTIAGNFLQGTQRPRRLPNRHEYPVVNL